MSMVRLSLAKRDTYSLCQREAYLPSKAKQNKGPVAQSRHRDAMHGVSEKVKEKTPLQSILARNEKFTTTML